MKAGGSQPISQWSEMIIRLQRRGGGGVPGGAQSSIYLQHWWGGGGLVMMLIIITLTEGDESDRPELTSQWMSHWDIKSGLPSYCLQSPLCLILKGWLVVVACLESDQVSQTVIANWRSPGVLWSWLVVLWSRPDLRLRNINTKID